MLTVAVAALVADVASKLWAVSQLPYRHETRGPAGVGLFLVFNRTPSFDVGHVAIASLLLVVIKFVVLGYSGWRLPRGWRAVGLGLILGGAVANTGNWTVTHAVADFLVMPWATVNLADLFILLGSAVVVVGCGVRVHAHFSAGTLKIRGRLPSASVSTAELLDVSIQPPRYPGSAAGDVTA
jgi:lipoprotein signal peptidase